MKRQSAKFGFTLIEVIVATAVFLLFALGVYSGVQLLYKVVYASRVRILETTLLSEELETARNLPFEQIGLQNGIPNGILLHAKTVVRNGTKFNVITTVRNIDDPFDGMVTGTPTRDTSPADYKMVEVSALCDGCLQSSELTFSTIIPPKQLEGASQNGHLFVQVFNSVGSPVVDAKVKVVNTARNITLEDVTGNDGWLRVIDVPTGTLSYQITVTKDGYSSDYTVSSTVANPNPLSPPANIASQKVTEISFAIDTLASLKLRTINSSCGVLPGIGLSMRGAKRLGKDPDVYKFNKTFSTDSNGDYSIDDLEWDNYLLNPVGSSYDIAGTIPVLKLGVTPGLSQEASLILRPHTANSLLVKVLDSGTSLPLSNASVRLTNGSYDRDITTGVGYVRQTNWSGGSNQVDLIDDSAYFGDSGGLDINNPIGDIKLNKTGLYYAASGWLESSTFDLGGVVDLHNFIWEPNIQPTSTGANSIRFQLASSNSSSPTVWSFIGPDGTADSYYTATNTVISTANNGYRYMRYKMFMSTDDNLYTPQLSEVAITYTNSCTPPGQAFFYSLSADSYNLTVSRLGYDDYTGTVSISGNNEIEIMLPAI